MLGNSRWWWCSLDGVAVEAPRAKQKLDDLERLCTGSWHWMDGSKYVGITFVYLSIDQDISSPFPGDILQLVDTCWYCIDILGKVWGECTSSQGAQDEQYTMVFSLLACHRRFSACSNSTVPGPWLFLTLGCLSPSYGYFDWGHDD